MGERATTTLLLVHVEDTFREHMTARYVRNLVKACRAADWVVHCYSGYGDNRHIRELDLLVNQQIHWHWWYEPGFFGDPDEDKWIVPIKTTRCADWSWVPPELRSPHTNRLILGGGFEGRCLAMMEGVLQHVKQPYEKRFELVYHRLED
jgi:hypothetical protein